MIGNCYTGRVKEENGKFYTYKPLKVFGNEPWEIEISEPDMTFEEMLNDEEMFVAHHLLELFYSQDELKEMGRYEIVPPNELIWMREGTHHKNKHIHKQVMKVYSSDEYKTNLSNRWKGRTFNEETLVKISLSNLSVFGRLFYNHFKILPRENRKLYKTEWQYWKKHNHKCRWEI